MQVPVGVWITTTVLGTCTQSIRPHWCLSPKYPTPGGLPDRPEHVTKDRVQEERNGQQTISSSSRIRDVGTASDMSEPILCRFSTFSFSSRSQDWTLERSLHVIGYIKNTMDYGLTYSQDADLTPLAYVDADYGGCWDTCWSTSGYVFMMAGRPHCYSRKPARREYPLERLLSLALGLS